MTNTNKRESDEAFASEIVTPKTDLVFRKIFGAEENKDILRSFLSAVLDMPAAELKELTIVNPYQLPEQLNGKLCIMDIKVTTASGHKINVELQRASRPHMRDRILCYPRLTVYNTPRIKSLYPSASLSSSALLAGKPFSSAVCEF